MTDRNSAFQTGTGSSSGTYSVGGVSLPAGNYSGPTGGDYLEWAKKNNSAYKSAMDAANNPSNVSLLDSVKSGASWLAGETLGLDDFGWAAKNASQGNWLEAVKSAAAGVGELGLTAASVAAAIPTGGTSLATLGAKTLAKEGTEQAIKGLTREAVEAGGKELTKNVLKKEAQEASARAISKENAAMAARTAGSTLPFSGKVGKAVATTMLPIALGASHAMPVAKSALVAERTLAAAGKEAAQQAATRASLKTAQETAEATAKNVVKDSVPDAVAKRVSNETSNAAANVINKSKAAQDSAGLGVNIVKDSAPTDLSLDNLTPASVQAPATVQVQEEVQNETSQNKGPSEPGKTKIKEEAKRTPKVKLPDSSFDITGEDLDVPYTY